MYAIKGLSSRTQKLMDSDTVATGNAKVLNGARDDDSEMDRILVTNRGFYHSVQAVRVAGTANFSITVYGSNDGVTWSTTGVTLTHASSAVTQFTGVYAFVKAVVNTLTSGDLVDVFYANNG